MTRVHAADGSLIAEYARERRLYVPIQATPKLVINAFLSAEDKNFYKHMGIDPEGIVRAVWPMSAPAEGASRALRRSPSRSPRTSSSPTSAPTSARSARRCWRSSKRPFPKDKILELYLNEIYLGLGNYGVAAAAPRTISASPFTN